MASTVFQKRPRLCFALTFGTLLTFIPLSYMFESNGTKQHRQAQQQRQTQTEQLYHHNSIQCAPDYHSCGSLPAPTSQLPCCNPQSYCYRRQPYFSQCRPRTELHLLKVCIPSWTSLCNQYDDIPCCSPSHQCISITPLHSYCIPILHLYI